jgi:hypothetical protein
MITPYEHLGWGGDNEPISGEVGESIKYYIIKEVKCHYFMFHFPFSYVPMCYANPGDGY